METQIEQPKPAAPVDAISHKLIQDTAISFCPDPNRQTPADITKETQALVDKGCLPTFMLHDDTNDQVKPKVEDGSRTLRNADDGKNPHRDQMTSNHTEKIETHVPVSPEEQGKVAEIISNAMKRLHDRPVNCK